MYTDAMAMAFRSLDHFAPKGFGVSIEDNDHFIVIRASEPAFNSLATVEEKRKAVEYLDRVKKAFEMNGAIVMIVREGGKEA